MINNNGGAYGGRRVQGVVELASDASLFGAVMRVTVRRGRDFWHQPSGSGTGSKARL